MASLSSTTGSHKKAPFVEFWKGIGLWGYIVLFILTSLQVYVWIFLPVAYAFESKPATVLENVHARNFRLIYLLRTGTTIIDEQALLWDSSPLYLPTKHNYSQTITRFQKHFYGNELLMMYAPRLEAIEQFKKQMPVAFCCKLLRIKDILTGVGVDVFKSMGQEPLAIDPLKLRFAKVCVRNFATQEVVYCKVITNLEGIPTNPILWEYAAFTLDVTPIGKSVPALTLCSSGQEILDQAFQRYIQQGLDTYQLPVGYYEIDFTP